MTTAIRPRRRPTLRLVAPTLDTTRHVRLWSDGLVICRVIEVWTFEEWRRLSEVERPEYYDILPGIGFLAVREPHGWLEREDIKDICVQAWHAYKEPD